ncbi:GMP/IMP nucleotidase [Psychromonas sp. MB-3u-54]|uniref:GMP/IMP nucleotidase n=1 Tax=Psychromonas sp. MB-3u-54 TaxID=2058319 RepID=UPI000C33337D|nr:GMP/IMP nucleotidase [Psychromonas sp. MB-3u-54]PKH01120.1 GMP/IMP nucleotidase [Psychromonas sp. MB-3u-54]
MHSALEVDTVLLDMDGTLLDLHYDNHFWMEYVPRQYAQKAHISLAQAQHHMSAQYTKVAGSLDWYCYDYWSATLGLDIHQLQYQTKHKIQLRSDTLWFLEYLKSLNKRVIMLTNAHRSGIALKMQQCEITHYFEAIVSSHDYRIAKESRTFWQMAAEQYSIDFKQSLFIDDSEKILQVAQQVGVAYLRGIKTPDSEKPAQEMQHFQGINLFSELLIHK